jgi:hypothetical protein
MRCGYCGAFARLLDVRYLAGNPWPAVNDPPVIRRASAMKIERAAGRPVATIAR